MHPGPAALKPPFRLDRYEGSPYESSPCEPGPTRHSRAGQAFENRLVGPGEGDLVERFWPEALRRACDHAPAERTVKLGGRIVIRQRPHHHALQAALGEIAARRVEQAPAETETLEFRTQIELVDFALEMQAARAVAAIIGIAGHLVAKHQHADAATFADRAVPPLRATAVDQLFQLGAGYDALISRAPGFVMGRRYRCSVCSLGRPNLD